MIVLILLLFCVVAFVASIEDRLDVTKKNLLLVVITMALVLVAGFRPEEFDHDRSSYVKLFISGDFDITMEFTIVFIASLVKSLSADVIFLFIIYALLALTVEVKAITKLTDLVFLSLLIYMSNYYLLHGMNQIRAGVAAGFFLYALSYLGMGDRKKYLLYVLCASCFHYTATVLFLLVFFSNKPFKRWQYLFFASIVPACYLLYFFKVNVFLVLPISYIEEKIEMYRELQDEGKWNEINVFNMVFLMKIFITYFLLWKNRLIAQYNDYVVILLKIQILSLGTFILFYDLPVLSFRLSELLGVVEVILYPLIFYTVKPAFVSRVLVVSLALAFLCIGVFYNQIVYV